ncbi:hypothetical protein EDF56_107156 [Novosphingobium sp. PhB165]|uniref:hypothetical protein n=1 Tax=Novosphingobium sp. PhB165 TaxID=2485105 RepID=UPI001045E26D|nr:hypothetical protein [Novosphingobium sp. PhB165]TCM16577.1 hypothetical protein EDF56_107156 [Novosphingobium sp. PhB165]
MKTNSLIVALAVAVSPLAVSPAFAQAPAAAPAATSYTTAKTDLGTLLDNPATKAVLQKYIPNLIANPQIDQARGMTLKEVQSYAADQLTDDTLAKIDADLAKIPAKK